MWSLVARTPMSAPASRFSLPIRKTRPQIRCANSLRCRADVDDALVDLAQQHARVDHLRRQRVEQFVGRNDRHPSGCSETFATASWMMRSCERSWLLVPAASIWRKQFSQNRRRTGNSG